MWSRAGLVCMLALAAFAGCDRSDDPEQRAETGGREVALTVQRLERAIAARDFTTVCRRLFTEAVREQAGGGRCASMLRRTSRGLRRPRIRVRSVAIQGTRARVEVTTAAQGQAPARDTIQLRREGGSWRVAALGG